MKNYQSFDQFLNENLNEAKVIYKRAYTDRHPARSTNEKAAVRTKVLDSIQDKTLTKEELEKVLEEIGANPRWISRNERYFKVSETGYTLSKFGYKVWEKIKDGIVLNEGNAFLFALKEAREKGEKTFEFNGKIYTVKDKQINEEK